MSPDGLAMKAVRAGSRLWGWDGPACGVEALEPQPRPDRPLDARMILFDDVVQVLALTQLGEPPWVAGRPLHPGAGGTGAGGTGLAGRPSGVIFTTPTA